MQNRIENGFPKTEQVSTKEAEEVLILERNSRIEKCRSEIQQILDKYECMIDVSMILKQNQVIAQATIISKR